MEAGASPWFTRIDITISVVRGRTWGGCGLPAVSSRRDPSWGEEKSSKSFDACEVVFLNEYISSA